MGVRCAASENADEETREHRLKAEHGQGRARNNPSHRAAVVEVAKVHGTPLFDGAQEKKCSAHQRYQRSDQASFEAQKSNKRSRRGSGGSSRSVTPNVFESSANRIAW